MIYYYVTYCFR